MPLGVTIKIKFDSAAVQRGLAALKKGLSSLADRGKAVFSALLGPTAKLAAMLGPTALAGSLIGLVKGASDTASRFEQMSNMFLMFTGSAEGTLKIMKQLKAVDLVSNLDLETLGQGAKMLMSYGDSADDAVSTVEKLSKVSGGSAEKFERLALAMGQTAAGGSLKGDDLKQFVENGWNPLQQIMAKTGETYEQVRERMQDHKVSLAEVKFALNEVTSGTGRFARAHELGSKTFLAATSRMESQWAQLQKAFGEPLNLHLADIFDKITAKLPTLTAQAKEWGTKVGSFLESVVNSFGNGDAGNVIKATFMLAVKMAGAELIALSTLAGEAFIKAATGKTGQGFMKWLEDINPIRGLMEGAGFNPARGSNSDVFKTQYDMGSYQENRTASYQVMGVEQTSAALQQLIDRNQGSLPAGFRYAGPGESSAFSDGNGNKVIQLLDSINRNLSPQP